MERCVSGISIDRFLFFFLNLFCECFSLSSMWGHWKHPLRKYTTRYLEKLYVYAYEGSTKGVETMVKFQILRMFAILFFISLTYGCKRFTRHLSKYTPYLLLTIHVYILTGRVSITAVKRNMKCRNFGNFICSFLGGGGLGWWW